LRQEAWQKNKDEGKRFSSEGAGGGGLRGGGWEDVLSRKRRIDMDGKGSPDLWQANSMASRQATGLLERNSAAKASTLIKRRKIIETELNRCGGKGEQYCVDGIAGNLACAKGEKASDERAGGQKGR